MEASADSLLIGYDKIKETRSTLRALPILSQGVARPEAGYHVDSHGRRARIETYQPNG